MTFTKAQERRFEAVRIAVAQIRPGSEAPSIGDTFDLVEYILAGTDPMAGYRQTPETAPAPAE